MTTKIVLIVFVLLAETFQVKAQESDTTGITSGITRFIKWVSNIDQLLSSIEKKENLESLQRNLGYASLYIDQIATDKFLLSKEITDLKTDKDDNKHISSLDNRVGRILESIQDLTNVLNSIKSSMSQTNQKEIDSIITEINRGFTRRKMFLLKDIREGIYSKNIPYDKIQNEAEESRKIADKALSVIKIAKDKIVSYLTKE